MTEPLHYVLGQLASCLLQILAKYICVIWSGYRDDTTSKNS